MIFYLILLPESVGESWLEATHGERRDSGGPPDPQVWDAGLVAYVPQFGVPLAEAEATFDAAVDVLVEDGPASAYIWPRDGFRVYFSGPATLADAAERLKKWMMVAEESDRFTVQWGDGPRMEVTSAAGPRIVAEAAEVAEDHSIPAMAAYDRRFEVTFDDLNEALDEINTMIEVTLHLQDLTGGHVQRSWNSEVSPPYVDDPADGS
ncbi:hypothetical protein ACK8GG_20545 [Micromonosporaceae bacterium DT55]|uniref:hypothetical protein n=1 Tax=Melissospora conviva TaxID=3388432 RepID=UPI003C278B3F